MAKNLKIMTASINLPVESLETIIDVENRLFEININDAIKKLSAEKDSYIKTMNTLVTIPEEMENKKYVEPEYINIEHGTYFINNIEEKEIEKTNELKFFKIDFEFTNGIKKSYVFPSYVKFYSSHKGMFIPVEFLKSRDILMDISGCMVKIEDATEVPDFEMTNYYNIKVAYERDEDNFDERKIWFNFYLNGILANVSYNNFQKKEKESTK
jgi:hypothetical protein